MISSGERFTRRAWFRRCTGVFIAVPLGILCACQPSSSAPQGGVVAPPPPAAVRAASSATTRWVLVRPAEDAALLSLPARSLLPPQGSAAINAPYVGRVVRCHVQPGSKVVAGSVVVDFQMPELAAGAAAYAAAGVRLAAYAERKEQLQALRREGLARLDETSEVDMRHAEAKAEQLRARAILRSAGVSPDDAARIGEAGGLIALRSPIAGVVVEVNAPLGESREPNGAPLVRVIGGGGAARVEARIGQSLPEGAQFSFVTAEGKVIPVSLAALAPAGDTHDGTRLAWFDGDTAGNVVPAGVPGVLRVQLAAAANTVLIPARAVARRPGPNGHPFVRKQSGISATEIEVSVLASSGSEALVRGALALGDAVAADVSSP